MIKGGAERKTGQMARAMENLKKVVNVIKEGKAGVTVIMPIEQATLALRIKQETLERMEKRRQELGISVVDKNVVVKLHGRESERREAYLFLYGLTESIPQGIEQLFLKSQEVPEILLKEYPRLKDTIELLEAGTLPEEVLTSLHIHLTAHYLSLRDRSNLPDPINVFSALMT